MKYLKEGSNKPSPLASVIIPTYNRPESLKEAIQSVLRQEYTYFEIIVINDGGVDVQGVINGLNAGKKIRYINHEKNRGLAAARNIGIRIANGKYIAYLDDDDIFYPSHLDILVNFLESNEFKVAFTEACRAYQTKENGKYIISKRDIPYAVDFCEDQILINNMMPVLCVMHEKSCLDEVGLFDESLTTHEDWDLWIRMSRKFRFAHIADLTCEFRWREDRTTMSSAKREDFLWTMEIIHKKYRTYLQDKPNIRLKQKEAMLEILEEVYLWNSVGRVNTEFNTDRKSKEKLQEEYRQVQRVVKTAPNGESTSALMQFLSFHPDHNQANKDLANILLRKGNKWQALAHVAQSLSTERENIDTMKTYAHICFDLGLHDRALKLYQDVSRINPNDLKSLLAQVGLLFLLRQNKAALHIFLEVIRKALNVQKLKRQI
jgi:glycosyltransferase involved in cell wall biosynthesis